MKNSSSDVLAFRSFVTHKIIKFLFWALSFLLITGHFFAMIVAAYDNGAAGGFGMLLGGGIVVGTTILIMRVLAESVIVIFGIYDELRRMNQ